jgi:hypothetical protein
MIFRFQERLYGVFGATEEARDAEDVGFSAAIRGSIGVGTSIVKAPFPFA